MKQRIDITGLDEAELVDLNNRIVARLRFLQHARAHAGMLSFSIGDKVAFHPEGRGPLFGVVTRYNKKTVSVVTDGGERWNVAPALLRRVKDVQDDGAGSNVVELPRK